MTQPRRNRVDPFGAIMAVPDRGDLMGNRGCLHDDHGNVTRTRTNYKGWVACNPKWPGVKRTLMAPGMYTELFFLDEATALAAGHRPCMQCRRSRATAFRAAWIREFPDSSGLVGAIDQILHRERISGERQPYPARERLPDGAIVGARDGSAAWLATGGQFCRWSFAGYDQAAELEDADLVILTIPSILATLSNGYVPELHASATN